MIYDLALTTPSPIIVWSGKIRTSIVRFPVTREETDVPEEGVIIEYEGYIKTITEPMKRDLDYASMALSKRDLNFNLIRCHPIIAQEAAMALYRNNTFSFQEPLEGIVENINPAVEHFFELLGSEGPKLKDLTLTRG
ncbi:hypothetical protein G7Y89_g8946 [Cudoniella acicularis]|uniref:Uncharacterized protein n=1 Tax=Cudoniella acicularis TaxID=354080 RepID=A0A8H4RIF0_9HELO|nr:hypothetical protein G7Y89_g8946 [Cudoniella acicularis]